MFHAIIFSGYPGTPLHPVAFKRPSGPHRIATILRQLDWDVEVLDFILGWNIDQLKEFCKQRITKNTVWVGFGGTFPIWNENIPSLFKWIRTSYPNIKIVAGGQISNVLKIKADWYIRGFGENAIIALCKHLVGNSLDKLKFRVHADGKKVIYANEDYAAYPMKSLKVSYQSRDFIQHYETLNVELGRGCVFKCSFCNFPILGVKEDHSREADDFYEELQSNHDLWGVSNYTLADETVNDYSAKLQKFAGAVKKLNFRPKLFGFARGDLFGSRKQDWDTMLEMGFIGHHYGIESTNKASIKIVGKGNNPDQVLSRILEGRSYMRKHGDYKATMSFIVGLPYETRESFSKTMDWIKQNWKHESFMLFPLAIHKNNGQDNPSIMSNNYSQLGYKITKENLFEKIANDFNWIVTQYGTHDSLSDFNVISWENDEWNIYDVYKVIANYYEPNVYNNISGPTIWTLINSMTTFNKPLDFYYDKTNLEIMAGYNEKNYFQYVRNQGVNEVNKYINYKLNWK